MLKVPERYSYIECYLCLYCNFNCPWCINTHSDLKRKRDSLSAKEWSIALNNLDTGNLPITLGGGEPTLHPGFYDILNSTDKTFDLLTNGTFDLDYFLRKTTTKMFTSKEDTSYKSIRISYHPGQSKPDQIIKVTKALNDAGYRVGIFGTSHPSNLRANIEFTEMAYKAGVFFFIRDFLGFYQDHLYGDFYYPKGLNGNKKKCECRIQELLVGPDGLVYRCHKDLYEDVNPIGSILDMSFEIEDIFRSCNNYGICNECDLKRKMSPDLKTSKCSIEIKEII